MRCSRMIFGVKPFSPRPGDHGKSSSICPARKEKFVAKISNKINSQLMPYCKHVLGELNGAIAMVLIS